MTDSMRRMHTPQEIAAFASEKLNPSITKAQETADQANAIVAPEFSKTENYAAGAYVRHEGKLYRFAAPHSAGDWTGTDAVETTIVGPLASQASEITNHTARIALLQNDITATYNGNSTYNTGDLCMKDYKLYKCKEDGVTGAWDATKWEETNILQERKPLYCHPINLSVPIDSGNFFTMTMLIFNNDGNPFTWASFNDWLDSLVESIGSARIMASGSICIGGTVYPANYLYGTASERMPIVYPGVQGFSPLNLSFTIAQWKAITPSQFNDGVNRIN